MSEFQQKLLDMSEEDLFVCIAGAIGELRDIATSTGDSYTVVVTPDKRPVVLKNGEPATDYFFGGEPSLNSIMGDPLGQLGRL